MPIPASSISTIEVQILGAISAGGSGNTPTATIFHFTRISTGAPLVKANINSAFQTAIGANLVACLNVGWSQSENTVRYVDDALDPPVPFTEVHPGTVIGDGMASFLAAYQVMRTAVRGRSYRGSKHYPGLSESDTTSGAQDVLNAAALTRFAALATSILAGFTDSDGNVWIPVILSRVLSQLTINPTTVVVTPVSQISTNKRIGRMKRRQRKSVY